jgi:hypothetical protein
VPFCANTLAGWYVVGILVILGILVPGGFLLHSPTGGILSRFPRREVWTPISVPRCKPIKI